MSNSTEQPATAIKLRTIHSFVRRDGRLTQGQKRALDELWPQHGIEFEKKLLDFNQLFSGSAPVTLEIGFGNGKSLAEMAENDPQRNFIGIEVYRAGVGQLLAEIEQRRLNNLKIVNHDAMEVLTSMVPAYSLDRVQLFFPDPWPKKKHHKRRIVNSDFLDLLAEKLKAGGLFHMATDWEHYAEQALERLQAHQSFRNTSADNGFVPRPEHRPVTKFERRGKRLNHGVWDLVFERI